MRLVIDEFFKGIGVTPRVVMEPFDTETIKSLVESGFGYSILPEHALRQPKRQFQVCRVEGHRLHRKLALATVSTAYPRRLTDAITHSLSQLLAIHVPGKRQSATPIVSRQDDTATPHVLKKVCLATRAVR